MFYFDKNVRYCMVKRSQSFIVFGVDQSWLLFDYFSNHVNEPNSGSAVNRMEHRVLEP